MIASKRLAPPNSVILVMDGAGGNPPESMKGSAITYTPTCIAIGCLSEVDGETTITLGAVEELAIPSQPLFEGTLRTPSRRVSVRSVLWDAILETNVPADVTKVTVWTNDASEPDEVRIGLRSAE